MAVACEITSSILTWLASSLVDRSLSLRLSKPSSLNPPSDNSNCFVPGLACSGIVSSIEKRNARYRDLHSTTSLGSLLDVEYVAMEWEPESSTLVPTRACCTIASPPHKGFTIVVDVVRFPCRVSGHKGTGTAKQMVDRSPPILCEDEKADPGPDGYPRANQLYFWVRSIDPERKNPLHCPGIEVGYGNACTIGPPPRSNGIGKCLNRK
ncbi:hypothetical protein BU16DRAFT_288815 [Lophium mytilinum]|uniref:Uncharacterized protein n=1 Tax=Lophium mytilinum TaxID=390894 RepID=A0A6A6R209_9PEZI|nr:hypothetical protein BU16DRAFT_288815 [Lophium mytilinum]